MAPKSDFEKLYGDRCGAQDTVDGQKVICLRTTGHDKSLDAKRAMHYDVDAELYFGAKGKIEILIEVPGQAEPFVVSEGLPKGWANMTYDQQRNHLGWREEDVRDAISVTAEYNSQA